MVFPPLLVFNRVFVYTVNVCFVGVAELEDALGLGPSGATHESSNLSSDTQKPP